MSAWNLAIMIRTESLTVPSASHNFWNEEQPFGALFGAPLQAQAYASHIADMGGEIHYKTVAKYLIRGK